MDVRAPVEFEQGAFPCATNLPLLDNDQRHRIGIQYKEYGQDAAIKLGWSLATSEVITHRIEGWRRFVEQHPNGYLYCFRGGLRSRLSQQLIKEQIGDYPLVTGGYKAMRKYLLEELERVASNQSLILISGRTGSGKTIAINQIARSIDLEGLAKHRGSAFGSTDSVQPAQIDFENALSVQLLKLRCQNNSPFFLEDEGKLIGKINIPLPLRTAMKKAAHITLTSTIEERIDRVINEYIIENYHRLLKQHSNESAQSHFRCYVLNNLYRIRKRLGGERYRRVKKSFDNGIELWTTKGISNGFQDGIQTLLTEYYDPMYDYQQKQRSQRELFRGNIVEISDWAANTVHTQSPI